MAASGTASAQWFPFGGNSCNCATPARSASVMSTSYGAAYAGESVMCGQPINCTITQPVAVQSVAIAPTIQTVKVQSLQPVVHPVYDTVQVTEYKPFKQVVSRPVVETKMVEQSVTEMRPVTQQKTVNVPTVEYQTVTEYKQVQKQVGYWATKTESTGKVAACQYDNRPGFTGWMNRTAYDIRNAFTPSTKVTRQYVPQTMTCTVPCTKRVAVQGMKQVTYNVTSMVPTPTTRKVAVSSVRHVEEEITVMKPVTVARTMQVGTRISYAPINEGATASNPGNGGPTALTPTEDATSSAVRPRPERTATGETEPLEPDNFMRSNGANPRRISYPVPERAADQGDLTDTVVPSRAPASQKVIRVSQWVARTPAPSGPDSLSVAENAR